MKIMRKRPEIVARPNGHYQIRRKFQGLVNVAPISVSITKVDPDNIRKYYKLNGKQNGCELLESDEQFVQQDLSSPLRVQSDCVTPHKEIPVAKKKHENSGLPSKAKLQVDDRKSKHSNVESRSTGQVSNHRGEAEEASRTESKISKISPKGKQSSPEESKSKNKTKHSSSSHSGSRSNGASTAKIDKKKHAEEDSSGAESSDHESRTKSKSLHRRRDGPVKVNGVNGEGVKSADKSAAKSTSKGMTPKSNGKAVEKNLSPSQGIRLTAVDFLSLEESEVDVNSASKKRSHKKKSTKDVSVESTQKVKKTDKTHKESTTSPSKSVTKSSSKETRSALDSEPVVSDTRPKEGQVKSKNPFERVTDASRVNGLAKAKSPEIPVRDGILQSQKNAQGSSPPKDTNINSSAVAKGSVHPNGMRPATFLSSVVHSGSSKASIPISDTTQRVKENMPKRINPFVLDNTSDSNKTVSLPKPVEKQVTQRESPKSHADVGVAAGQKSRDEISFPKGSGDAVTMNNGNGKANGTSSAERTNHLPWKPPQIHPAQVPKPRDLGTSSARPAVNPFRDNPFSVPRTFDSSLLQQPKLPSFKIPRKVRPTTPPPQPVMSDGSSTFKRIRIDPSPSLDKLIPRKPEIEAEKVHTTKTQKILTGTKKLSENGRASVERDETDFSSLCRSSNKTPVDEIGTSSGSDEEMDDETTKSIPPQSTTRNEEDDDADVLEIFAEDDDLF